MPFPFPHLQWGKNMQLIPSIKVQNKETPRPITTKTMLLRDKYLTWMINPLPCLMTGKKARKNQTIFSQKKILTKL